MSSSATDWKLEVVPVQVSDLDRAKHLYGEQCSFAVELDIQVSPAQWVLQLTPPDSGCSIQLSSGIHKMVPGSLRGLQIVVGDLEAARRELLEHGVEVSPVRHMENGVWLDGPGGCWNSFAFFGDPGGNTWVLPELPAKQTQ